MSCFIVERLENSEILLIRPRRFVDQRGYFMETYREADFRELGIGCSFIQDNHSYSAVAGTIRGLHFQRSPKAQAKLVRVSCGAIFDAAVDLRPDSPTFGRWFGTNLSAEGGEMLFIPAGFAHGFCTLVPDTHVSYKVDAYYSLEHDAGVRWNDPQIGVDWPVNMGEAVLSEKDKKLPLLASIMERAGEWKNVS
jgi:dTDP-4-dehydrorhamnose 3,5-epimerase